MVIPPNIACKGISSWRDMNGVDHSVSFVSHMDDYHLNNIQCRLLIAALLQGKTIEAPMNASTGKIIRQALLLSGMSSEEVDNQWRLDESGTPNTRYDEYYKALLPLTDACKSPPTDSNPPHLFVTYGNWGQSGNPAFPEYNSCRLNYIGETFAKALLQANSELRQLKAKL